MLNYNLNSYFYLKNRLRPSFEYRKDINALRGLAILMVLLNHINKSLLPSGYLGVDIFFVISGFVVSLSFLRSKTNSLKELILDFFSRRFRRLYPALLIFLILNIFFYIIFINPFSWITRSELNSSLSALFGISNLYFLRTQLSYFGDEFSYNPFLHTWSLGVEEQFYLIFPFFIVFVICLSKGYLKNILSSLLFFAVLSFVCFFGTSFTGNTTFSFFFSPFRFWEMILGSITYFLSCSDFKLSNKFSNLLNLVSLLFICFIPFIRYENFSPLLVLIICIFTSVNILSYQENFFISFKKYLTPLQFLGDGSYSIYLYHWPLIVYSKWLFPQNNLVSLFFGLLSIPIGYISFQFIELKFLRNNNKKRVPKNYYFFPNYLYRPLLVFLPTTVVLLFSNINFKIYKYFSKFSIAEPSKALNISGVQCKIQSELKSYNLNSNKINFPKAFIIGDSHAQHLFPMLESALNSKKYNIEFIDARFDQRRKCNIYELKSTIESLNLNKDDLFILSFHRGRLSMNNSVRTGDRADVYHWDPEFEAIENEMTKLTLEKILFLAKYLNEFKVNLILISDTPTSMVQLNTNMCTLFASKGRQTPCHVNTLIDKRSRLRQDYVFEELKKKLEQKGIKIYHWDPYSLISRGRNKFEPFDKNGIPLLSDGHHLTYEASSNLGKYFKKFLETNKLFVE